MSVPKIFDNPKIDDISVEIEAGISCLYMEDVQYSNPCLSDLLADKYVYAKHSAEHLRAALIMLERLNEEIND